VVLETPLLESGFVVIQRVCIGFAIISLLSTGARGANLYSLQHHPASTTSAQAQQCFDRGLTLVCALNRRSSARIQLSDALYGLYRNLKAQGHSTNAEWVYLQFQTAWKNADTAIDTTLW